ncbi:MAG: hypothetical protein JW864_08995 [Spirochaetes bacterium]|nr:hypothetical protein [Spirochaetota bacterium]
MINSKKTWSFPENIDFEMVIQYVIEFEENQMPKQMIFDLTKTKYVHSSFVGFLINAKQKAGKSRSELQLLVSPEIEKIFINMDLGKFLQYQSAKNELEKKSA